MDPPAWIAVNPTAVEAYCCPADTSGRGALGDDGNVRTHATGKPMVPNAPNQWKVDRYRQPSAGGSIVTA
ncbi:MAG: hypothetical protein AAGK57_12870 [Pseudomonadota bacterium]